ncbi:DEAD/DEAH box helicase [Elizabethkingia sp. JS20170427COW]|uniref:DEAD/DEAH box helicase n=1 Tax=Elizabethkingia sp. JS20170427COW TaxID=2583851 RepID=UPI0011103729|nr:DEAD/DEAH box helicase [Elizabethkingia sp. JS20170427COW]QCX53697.1 ATP-dependent helicase [Elizabethkingia sp. JS20170427COW]
MGILKSSVFNQFILNHTTLQSQERASSVQIFILELDDHIILAQAKGTHKYTVKIAYTSDEVVFAKCSCPYDKQGYCKHIIATLIKADSILPIEAHQLSLFEREKNSFTIERKNKDFYIHSLYLNRFQKDDFLKILALSSPSKKEDYIFKEVIFTPNDLTVCLGKSYFDNKGNVTLHLQQEEACAKLSCSCLNSTNQLCGHIKKVLEAMSDPNYKEIPWQLAFNKEKRRQVLSDKLSDFEDDGVTDWDELYTISYVMGRIYINENFKILSLKTSDYERLRNQFFQKFKFSTHQSIDYKEFIVFEKQDYCDSYTFQLMQAPISKTGAIKSPITSVDLLDKLKEKLNHEEVLFYSSLLSLKEKSNADKEDYLHIIKNPFGLEFFKSNNTQYYNKLTPKNLKFIQVESPALHTAIFVKESKGFYVLSCQVKTYQKTKMTHELKISGRFILGQKNICYIHNDTTYEVLNFFRNNEHQIYIPKIQFSRFKEGFLDPLEDHVEIHYSFIAPASQKVIKDYKMDKIQEQLIYLSEEDQYIKITPAVRYGEVEVPLLSKRKIYTENPDGSLCSVTRNERLELNFLHVLQSQHPSFAEYPIGEFFYLHREEFLESGWFINALETWREHSYGILGFKQLKNNPYNLHKMKVQTHVQSGINWFDVQTRIQFGKQEVSLKNIQKSVANKSKYVVLDDGSYGMIPEEWLEKLSKYFRSGEIKNNSLHTHKSNFLVVNELFEKESMDDTVKIELENYLEKFNNFHSIRKVEVPKKLKATLRDYQKEGLNWLNFLDEFGFGGCLADDMGLGKTLQIIAYFLAQHEKGNQGINLVVLPTSLLFNWKREIEKFAPHLRYYISYGAERDLKKVNVKDYDLLITTYGTLLSDIEDLKEIDFNIIVLDESQAIKNPNSQRYKAVQLLKGRQRLVVTGTPIENNTFDLYAQISFAVPGLLGNVRSFTSDYSTPIDKFQDDKRAQELQKKIHPFVLRRTKEQVAKELPPKTEMVIYCEMNHSQQRVYDTYKAEFQKYL